MEVALHGLVDRVIPDCAMRLLRTGGQAGPAADALFAVYSSNVAVRRVHESGACGALFHAYGSDALPAWSHDDVIREFAERVLHNLNPRERQVLNAFVHQRTAEHAGRTPGALLAVIDQVSFGCRKIGFCRRRGYCWNSRSHR